MILENAFTFFYSLHITNFVFEQSSSRQAESAFLNHGHSHLAPKVFSSVTFKGTSVLHVDTKKHPNMGNHVTPGQADTSDVFIRRSVQHLLLGLSVFLLEIGLNYFFLVYRGESKT